MKLYIIGTGLNGFASLTQRGYENVSSCLEIYTLDSCEVSSKSPSEYLEMLSDTSTKSVHVGEFLSTLERRAEHGSDEKIALLLEGDPFFHGHFPKIKEKCKQLEITFKVVHNASPMNVVGCSGLQLYRFGETVFVTSVDSFEKKLETVKANLSKNLHTLLYFDGDFEEMIKHSNTWNSEVPEKTFCVVIKKSSETRLTISSNHWEDLDLQPKSGNLLVICSELHPLEEEALTKLEGIFSGKKSTHSSNTFHLIGLGLDALQDVTLEAGKAIEGSRNLFLESYTAVMTGLTDWRTGKLVEPLNDRLLKDKKIVVADRDMVESNSSEIISKLKEGDVSFLVVGDPLMATTHSDLLIRVIDEGYSIDVFNNASIMNAAGVSCLPSHQFGEVVSIPFWESNWKPESFYDKIVSNMESKWHTLCLLDIKVKEQSVENLVRGRKVYEPPRYMRVDQAASQLLQIVENRSAEGRSPLLCATTPVIGLARIGTDSEKIFVASLEEASQLDLGDPLHSLIVCCDGDVNFYKNLAL